MSTDALVQYLKMENERLKREIDGLKRDRDHYLRTIKTLREVNTDLIRARSKRVGEVVSQ